MLVKAIMTHNAEVVSPGDTLEQAARKMEGVRPRNYVNNDGPLG